MDKSPAAVGLLLAGFTATATTFSGSPPPAAGEAIRGRLPLIFVPNRGQTDASIAFTAHGRGFGVFLMPAEVVMVRPAADTSRGPASVLRMRLAGAAATARMTGLEKRSGHASYFKGRDPERWRRGIPIYGRVRVAGVYPGIDVVYYGNPDQLEYDIVVAPGADPNRIQLDFPDADAVDVEANGDAVARGHGSEVRLREPRVYQEAAGVRRSVSGGYARLARNRLGLRLGPYDTGQPLVIDPVVAFSTYLGGEGEESGLGVAVDAKGASYVTGSTSSVDFDPAQNPYGGGESDAFIAKLDRTGALVYFTYLGGREADQGNGIAVDRRGRAYLTGQTASPDFPTVRALQATLGGVQDAFVARLGASGSKLGYATYLGGAAAETALGIALDGHRNAYVTGSTSSLDFPTRRAMQTSYGGGIADAFVSKLSPSGTLAYSTYLGGNNLDVARSVAVTPKGRAHVVGNTFSPNFPTSPPQPLPPGGMPDAFVTRVDRAGGISYSVPLRGSLADLAFGVALDAKENAYVTGSTTSVDFPTVRPVQPVAGGASDGFVTKLDRTASIVYSTFLGGALTDAGQGIAVDERRGAYVTGFTSSLDFPTAHAIQPLFGGGLADAFVTKLKAGGSALAYSTYLGGTGTDRGSSLAVRCQDDVTVTGSTTSTDFPVVKPEQTDLRGSLDAFVARLVAANERRDRCREEEDDDDDDKDEDEDERRRSGRRTAAPPGRPSRGH